MAFIAQKALILLKKTGEIVQTLCIYGACGIVTFGWGLSRLLHFDCKGYAPLWFCAALFIYNLDRLKTDPADMINTPHRSRKAARLRKASAALAMLAAAALVLVPMLERDWLMAAMAVCGGLFCANYSLSPLGFRFKDVPFVKTLFAPTIVTAALLGPPFLEQRAGGMLVHYAAVAAWTWCVLMFNMILCDLRDIRGDSSTGIKSLPVALGAAGTIRLLCWLLGAIVLMSAAGLLQSPPGNVAAWRSLGLVTAPYLACLLAVARGAGPRPECFYEWWVEGILFLPALVYPFAR
ncbi:MAG TPA: UbiA family prenyltransferase [Chthoniobacteraceae bacterium]|nr:UbiA family prenyltransferase [Chthoniobacteraceae bacterium]